MGFDQIEIVEPEPGGRQSTFPGERRPFKGDDIAPAHRQKVVDLLGGAEDHRLLEAQCRSQIGQHHSRGAVGNQRAIGPFQRAGNERVLV